MTKHKDAPPSSPQTRANGLSTPTSTPSATGKKESHGDLAKSKEIKKLLDMGVQRGFLTYEEVNELLPPEIISSEALDDVMGLLGENEIEVLDTTKRPRAESDDEDSEEAPLVARSAI